MSKALDGVRILDFTHVQSGPTCTQLLAWFGADVIKVEKAGEGDATRGQLRDIPEVDSLYFTMLNHNKRSITLNTKDPKGKEVLETLVKTCDVLVENFAPGALDRMGFTWERINQLNPRMIVASVKGFGPGKYEDCKVYENVAQCAGGAASTTGLRRRPAARHRRADRRQRHRPAPGARHRRRALPAQQHRPRPEGAGSDAGRRAEPLPGQAARPAAARARR
jgi:formyl-CoA transferase